MLGVVSLITDGTESVEGFACDDCDGSTCDGDMCDSEGGDMVG